MRVLAALLVLAVPLAGAAQEAAAPPPPAPPPAAAPPPPPAWKAQARAGLVTTSGNAETTTVTGGAGVSWADALNKVGVEGVVAYGESRVAVVNDADGDGTEAGEIGHRTQETVNNWNVKGRYDRSVTRMQGAFVGGSIGADRIAGKTVIGGGFAGWAAKLVKTADQELVAELGYDFSYEEYVRAGVKPVEIHSGRAFVGETYKLREGIGLAASVELLANLNTEKNALDAHSSDPDAKVTAFEDLRVNGKLAVTAALRSNVSLAVGFAVKWDRNPAPRPPIPGAPGFAPGYVPFAKEVDTLTDVALIVSFL